MKSASRRPPLPHPMNARLLVRQARRAAWCAAFLAAAAAPGAAQQNPSATSVRARLARADSAYDAGDREHARERYAEVLALDSAQSRAVFRLAQLEPSAPRALAFYRRYVTLEPSDPWGHMAEGDALARMGRWREGLAAYDRAAALAPAERDVTIGRARLLDRAGRAGDAAAVLRAWTAQHADDGGAWDALGRTLARSGRPRAAADAYGHAASLGVPGAATRLEAARAQSAFVAEPLAGSQRDSDGNATNRLGVLAGAMVADGTRLGGGVQRVTIRDDLDKVSGTDVFASLSARPSPAVRVEAQAGATLFGAPVLAGAAPWRAPRADVRLRLRAPLEGPSLELRAQHGALGYSPTLVANRVTRTEARATAEVPLGALRLRGAGRAGRVEATGEGANARTGYDAALVAPLGGRVQLSGQYRVLGFQRASLAGYFAPRRAETVEGGLYLEAGDDGVLALAADVGGGAQRVAEQGANPGRWTRALRAWAYASLALGPGRALYAELEAYDAPFAPEGVTTAGSWRFTALTAGVRWALR